MVLQAEPQLLFFQVMGGKSTGTFAVSNQLGIFDGEVVDVPFLKAPGFIKASVVDMKLGNSFDMPKRCTV